MDILSLYTWRKQIAIVLVYVQLLPFSWVQCAYCQAATIDEQSVLADGEYRYGNKVGYNELESCASRALLHYFPYVQDISCLFSLSVGTKVNCLDWSHDGLLAVGIEGQHGIHAMQLYSCNDTKVRCCAIDHGGSYGLITALQWNPYTHLLATSKKMGKDGGSQLAITRYDAYAHTFSSIDQEYLGGEAVALSWHPSGEYVAVACNGTIPYLAVFYVHKDGTLSGPVVKVLLDHSTKVCSGALSWDYSGAFLALGTGATGCHDTVFVYEFDDQESPSLEVCAHTGGASSVTALSWAPHTPLLAVGYEDSCGLALYSFTSASDLLKQCSIDTKVCDAVRSVCWNKHGSQVAVTVDGVHGSSLYVYACDHEKKIFTLQEKIATEAVCSAACWADDGTTLVVGDCKGCLSGYRYCCHEKVAIPQLLESIQQKTCAIESALDALCCYGQECSDGNNALCELQEDVEALYEQVTCLKEGVDDVAFDIDVVIHGIQTVNDKVCVVESRVKKIDKGVGKVFDVVKGNSHKLCHLITAVDELSSEISQIRIEDFGGTFTTLQAAMSKVCVLESKLDELSVTIDCDVDFAGTFTVLDAVESKVCVIDETTQELQSCLAEVKCSLAWHRAIAEEKLCSIYDLLETVQDECINEFNGTYTALEAIESKACVIDSKLDALSTTIECNVDFGGTYTALEAIESKACVIDSKLDALSTTIECNVDFGGTYTALEAIESKACVIDSKLDALSTTIECNVDFGGTYTALEAIESKACVIDSKLDALSTTIECNVDFGGTYTALEAIESKACVIDSKLDALSTTIDCNVDFGGTYTALEAIESKACVIDSKLDALSTTIDCNVDFGGTYTALEAIESKACVIDSKLDALSTTIECNVDFGGTYTALEAIESKACVIESKLDALTTTIDCNVDFSGTYSVLDELLDKTCSIVTNTAIDSPPTHAGLVDIVTVVPDFVLQTTKIDSGLPNFDFSNAPTSLFNEINARDATVVEWLKMIYILLRNVHNSLNLSTRPHYAGIGGPQYDPDDDGVSSTDSVQWGL